MTEVVEHVNIDEAREALNAINPHTSNLDRDQWVEVSMAAKACGLTLDDFLAWHKEWGYKDGRNSLRSEWRSFKAGGGIGPGTLFKYAKDAGWARTITLGGGASRGPSLEDMARLVAQRQAEAKKRVEQEGRVAQEAAQLWESLADHPAPPDHPYLAAKRIAPCGVRTQGPNLVIPAVNGDGRITSVQWITPEGQKRYATDGRIRGSYFMIAGDMPPADDPGCTILFAEGFATAASLHMATGLPVAVCFDAGNLKPAAEALRHQYPQAALIAAADDDATPGREDGRNPGVEAAQKAADAVGGKVCIPEFAFRGADDKDFNDLHRTEGLEAVKRAVLGAEPPALEDGVLDYVQASHLPDWTPPQELVEGLLLQGGMTVVYGDSNTGKSFLVLDLVAHISLGRAWFGRRVQQGAVVYLAAESPRSIMDRARALSQRLGAPLDQLFIVRCPIDLYDEKGDTQDVIATIRAIERRHRVRVSMVVADTLARVMGAGDESKTQDMGVVVTHVDRIRQETGVQFTIVHHTGKDAARGARGSSSLRAATDTEIEVKDPGNEAPKEFKCTKQRDLPGRGEKFGFILESVPLGQGIFGNQVTTCVVLQAEPVEEPSKRAGDGLKEEEAQIVDAIHQAPAGGLKASQLVSMLEPEGISRRSVYRHLKSLREAGRIYLQTGQYRLGNGVAMVRVGADF